MRSRPLYRPCIEMGGGGLNEHFNPLTEHSIPKPTQRNGLEEISGRQAGRQLLLAVQRLPIRQEYFRFAYQSDFSIHTHTHTLHRIISKRRSISISAISISNMNIGRILPTSTYMKLNGLQTIYASNKSRSRFIRRDREINILSGVYYSTQRLLSRRRIGLKPPQMLSNSDINNI